MLCATTPPQANLSFGGICADLTTLPLYSILINSYYYYLYCYTTVLVLRLYYSICRMYVQHCGLQPALLLELRHRSFDRRHARLK